MTSDAEKFYEKWQWALEDNAIKGCAWGCDKIGGPLSKQIITDFKSSMDTVPWLKRDHAFKKVLDIGSGEGAITQFWNEQGFEAEALSIADSDVEACKKLNLKVTKGDMHVMPFEDKSFDILWLRDVFEHSPAPFLLLCELNRVLTDNGIAIITMPNPDLWTCFTEHYSVLDDFQMLNLCMKSGFEQHVVEEVPPVEREENQPMIVYKKRLDDLTEKVFILIKKKDYRKVDRSKQQQLRRQKK